MTPYHRQVNYYETDQMGIVHHSNYIRYFEEARIDYMSQINCGVQMMEDMGLIIPNVDAYAKYISPLRFSDSFAVYVRTVKFTGVSMKFEYRAVRGDTLCATGFTTHCFVNRDYKPISVKHSHPDIYEKIKNSVSHGF